MNSSLDPLVRPGRVCVYSPDDLLARLHVRLDLPDLGPPERYHDPITRFDRALLTRFPTHPDILAFTFSPAGVVIGAGPRNGGRLGILSPPLPGWGPDDLSTRGRRTAFGNLLREEIQDLTDAEYTLAEGEAT